MTLGEFLGMLSDHPVLVTYYFTALPLSAGLGLWMSRGHAAEVPWKYFFSFLIFAACIPGIFSVTISAFQFLFKRVSIMETNIYLQIMPVISMILTLVLINKAIPFRQIPGFEKLSSLIIVIIAVFTLLWFVDRLRIISIVRLPLELVLVVLLASIFAILFVVRKFFKR